MKLNKIFAIALAAITMTACSDDDKTTYNTATGVSVSVGETTMTLGEDFATGVYYYLPIEVTGEANGAIEVTVDVAKVGSEPAVEDRDYVITSKTITIPEGDKVGYIEFYATGNDDINDDRTFNFTIVSAKGATVSNNATCLVTLLDEDHLIPEALDKLEGTWNLSGSRGTYPVQIVLYPEGNDLRTKEVTMTGIGGYAYSDGTPICSAKLSFQLDASTMCINLGMTYGQEMAKVSFNGIPGIQSVLLCGYDGTYLYPSGGQTLTSNVEVTQFVFEESFGGFFNAGGWYRWFVDENPVMNK